MASEREAALSAVITQTKEDAPKFEKAISDAALLAEQTTQLRLTHQHNFAMKNADLGWFGRIFGAEAQASITIAFVVVACGSVASCGLWWVAYKTGNREFWSGEAHIALGTVTTALGYVFGRGSKDASK